MGPVPRDADVVSLPRVLAVRAATIDDLTAIQGMALELLASKAYGSRVRPNAGQLATTIAWVIDDHGCFVAQTTAGLVGVIGVVLLPSPLTGELVGAEAMWWVDPPYRNATTARRLWRCAEQWARQHGAVLMHMVAPAGTPEIGQLYARRGYVPLETTWQLRLDEETDDGRIRTATDHATGSGADRVVLRRGGEPDSGDGPRVSAVGGEGAGRHPEAQAEEGARAVD